MSVSSLHTLTPKDIAAAAFLSPHTRLSSTAILISALLGQSEHLLHSICLAAAPYTRRITVFCAHSENAHHDEAPSVYSPSCYSDLAHRLTTTIHAAHNNNTTVAVKFLPMPCIPIGEAAFVFPAACNAAVTACAHGFTLGYSGRDIDDPEDNENEYAGNISSGNPKSEDFLFRKHNVPSAGQEPTHRKGKAPVLNHGVSVVAHALAHLAAELGVRPETFCIGPAAKAVGTSLYWCSILYIVYYLQYKSQKKNEIIIYIHYKLKTKQCTSTSVCLFFWYTDGRVHQQHPCRSQLIFCPSHQATSRWTTSIHTSCLDPHRQVHGCRCSDQTRKFAGTAMYRYAAIWISMGE